MAFEIVLIILCLVLAFAFEREHKKRLNAGTIADRCRAQLGEAIHTAASHGSSLRKWDRPTKHNKADEFYWLVRICKEDYLFTDEALKVAVKRADNMRERGLLTDD